MFVSARTDAVYRVLWLYFARLACLSCAQGTPEENVKLFCQLAHESGAVRGTREQLLVA